MFLQRWTIITQTKLERTFLTSPLPIFSLEIVQPPAENDETNYQATITEINCRVARERSDLGTTTIIDTLEETFWWGPKAACVTSFSDILLITLKREDHEGGAGVELLPQLSLARFASQYYDQAEHEVAMRRGLRDTLEKLAKREEELTWIEKMGKRHSAIQVLEATIQYVEEMQGGKIVDEQLNDEDVASRMDIDSEKTLPAVSAQLKASLAALKEKIKGTEPDSSDLEIQSTSRQMEEKLSTLFNYPDTMPGPASEDPEAPTTPITFAYTLRGIIIDQHLTFFSQWENFPNPYKRTLNWYKSDFSSTHEITPIDQGEVLTMGRERGNHGIVTIYVKNDVLEPMEKVLPPEYLRVHPTWSC